MSSPPPPQGPVRSAADLAAELNARIRALWSHPAARLTDEQRDEYRRLLAELRQVERQDVTPAA